MKAVIIFMVLVGLVASSTTDHSKKQQTQQQQEQQQFKHQQQPKQQQQPQFYQHQKFSTEQQEYGPQSYYHQNEETSVQQEQQQKQQQQQQQQYQNERFFGHLYDQQFYVQQNSGKKYEQQQGKTLSKDQLAKQKFLFEIVYRIEDPLMFEELIKLARSYTFSKTDFTHFDYHMEKFYQAAKVGALLPKGEFFGALVKTHSKQAVGLFKFFYYAKDFETFKHCVAWARMHVNEAMFIYALNLAVVHRPDFDGLVLPSIYEIFPQNFFNSKFVYHAEKFNYDVWSKLVMYEKEYKDVLYKDYTNQYKSFDNHHYFHTKDFKMWQWWKLMGLGQHFYSEDRMPLRNFDQQNNKDSAYWHGVKTFYMPVDYTRNIEFFNKESALSYFTEDLDWNAFWYYVNVNYAFFLDSKTFGLNKDRRGAQWLFTIKQILARYYQERLSHRFGEIPEFDFFGHIKNGYDPQLTYYNGVGYSYRKNYYEVARFGSPKLYNKIIGFFKRVDDVITSGFYKTLDGTVYDLRKPSSIQIIGNVMQGNADVYDQYFLRSWYMLTHMYFADVDYNDAEVFPNVLLNFETMMRDPLFYIIHKKIVGIYFQFYHYIKPYTQQELLLQGVTIKDVKVSDLVTYFDLVDFDVTNLLSDKMTFVEGQFVWDKTLIARQARLNHKPFNVEVTVQANQPQRVVVRTYLGPKFDEFGRVISIADNRENFVELDAFNYNLNSGVNVIKRNSRDYYFAMEDRTTYTELYKQVMFAYEGKGQYQAYSQQYCKFPNRLLLPRGWTKGMPMKIFIFVSAYSGGNTYPTNMNGQTAGSISGSTVENFNKFESQGSCRFAARYIDQRPFGYPLERVIDETEFHAPNMYFKDVKVYHEDVFAKVYGTYNFGDNYGKDNYGKDNYGKDNFVRNADFIGQFDYNQNYNQY